MEEASERNIEDMMREFDEVEREMQNVVKELQVGEMQHEQPGIQVDLQPSWVEGLSVLLRLPTPNTLNPQPLPRLLNLTSWGTRRTATRRWSSSWIVRPRHRTRRFSFSGCTKPGRRS